MFLPQLRTEMCGLGAEEGGQRFIARCPFADPVLKN